MLSENLVQEPFSSLGVYSLVLLKIYVFLIEIPFQVKVNYPCSIGPELDMPDSFVQSKEKINSTLSIMLTFFR